MSEEGGTVEATPESAEGGDPEIEYEVVDGPFAVLVKTLDYIDTVWDHAVGGHDFDKMMAVIDKTLEVNDRYMAVHMTTQEESNERIEGTPEQFGFSAEINNSERPPDVESR